MKEAVIASTRTPFGDLHAIVLLQSLICSSDIVYTTNGRRHQLLVCSDSWNPLLEFRRFPVYVPFCPWVVSCS